MSNVLMGIVELKGSLVNQLAILPQQLLRKTGTLDTTQPVSSPNHR